jgi:regulator of replication initiation timing
MEEENILMVMGTKEEDKINLLRKELRILKKENAELQLHNRFLTERLEKWADRNFTLRTGLLNSNITDKVDIIERSL